MSSPPYDTAAKVLSQPALIMTRQIEMMNVLVGFEQANKYAIVGPSGNPIGYIAEEDTTMMKTMSHELIGEVQQEWHLIPRRYNLFTIEQPDPSEYKADNNTSAISTDRNSEGKGLNRVQFADIDGGFLALDFDMQDEQGQKMASVNRNFVGFARELFTDSGQYCSAI
ncbi:hypothetical protein BGZ83_010401 [Gryganskiella cystojenkinii]|nr:hypothetical protein BGZ83_010401 [Gryganskiella cystojenkinii]